MTAFLLASWLATQQWSWTKSPTADSYRIYWSTVPSSWCWTTSWVLAASSHCGIANGCQTDDECCSPDLPEPPDPVTFLLVTASDPDGDSDTEHGPTHVPVCP